MTSLLSVVKKLNKRLVIYVASVLIPLVFLPLALSPLKESKCAYVMLIVAGYWMFEPVPSAATALLPVVLFPLLGVVNSNEICANYMKEPFLMFLGGLIVAIAVEECRLHERIALKVLLIVGTEIKWLMLGFMLTTMFLSMWVSNTATTAMMVPIVDAVISKITVNDKVADMQLQERNSITGSKQVDDLESDKRLSVEPKRSNILPLKKAMLLCVCYAANIGGTGTLTGTGPNLVLKTLVEDLYPGSNDITFASWMMYNVPGMLICVCIGWLYLWLVFIRFSKENHGLESKESVHEIISERYAQLGHISWHEGEVLFMFIVLVLLWVFRDPKFVTGWVEAIGYKGKFVGDSVPAIAVAFLFFFLPSNLRDFNSPPILEWKVAQNKLPWGVILLVGGGFALADGTQKSGLSRLAGQYLSQLSALSPGAIAAIICFMTAMITEIVSNTTTANILLPVFGQMAVSVGVNPLFLTLPVTVVCSYAFMLPVATPPNAIAYESGNMKTIDMAVPGLVMNLVCCGVQLIMLNTLGVAMFDLNNYPEWAPRPNATLYPQNMTNGTELL